MLCSQALTHSGTHTHTHIHIHKNKHTPTHTSSLAAPYVIVEAMLQGQKYRQETYRKKTNHLSPIMLPSDASPSVMMITAAFLPVKSDEGTLSVTRDQ